MAYAERKTNWFAIWISVAVVVVVVVVIGLVVWMNALATSPGAAPDSPAVNAETGAISVGDGPDTVSVWADFMCPHCQEFERAEGGVIGSLVEDGSITLDLHPVALANLDAASGTKFSTRSANALYCVAEADPEQVYPFFAALFASNPTPPGASDEQLLELAGALGVTGIDDCVNEVRYSKFVAAMTKNIPANPETGSVGTPALLVNGEFVNVTGNAQADIVNRLQG